MNVKDLNPCPSSAGMLMYEHWEKWEGEWSLLVIASTPENFELAPDDVVVTRRWGPASEPVTIANGKDRP